MAEAGAPHGTLVVADAQTAGRGRSGRNWITLPGTSLAFSLILRLSGKVGKDWLRLFGLSALSVANALDKFGLSTEIKWPNDVLLEGKKVAGILINNTWDGTVIDHSIIGVGVNVTPEAIPKGVDLDFPATSVEGVLGRSVDRMKLLTGILGEFARQYEMIQSQKFMQEWQDKLAYLDEEVMVKQAEGEFVGKVLGLNRKGELILLDRDNCELTVGFGDLSVRPSVEGKFE